jgi:hypothetical protein
MRTVPIAYAFYLTCSALNALADINLPERSSNAPGGTEFGMRIDGLDLPNREMAIHAEIRSGNVPKSWRRFAPVTITSEIGGERYTAEILVAPDYLAVGTDDDYLLTPLSPGVAQAIADELDCLLPTRRMVDEIYRAATVKLVPAPIPPSPEMVLVQTWLKHQSSIQEQLANSKQNRALVAGHKKEVVVSSRLADAPGKVAIYGWHRTDNAPIQPLYLGHTESWVDYSHGIRLVARQMKVNGNATTVEQVLADPKLCELLSDEGVIRRPRYPSPVAKSAVTTNEVNETVTFEHGVRIVINQPVINDETKPLKLILYATPSGNSIEHTAGRRTFEGDDWHFNIQHIAAQTRWLRERSPDVTIAVAYLECEGKSWPAWRRKHDPRDEQIVKIVDEVKQRFAGREIKLVLTGHSGGGSFTFGFFNGISRIPDDVERIAFLDSNYAYEAIKGHGDKLSAWLNASNSHYLCVVAYEDYVALLDGKTFVSEGGGTWGRSRAMLSDLGGKFAFTSENDADWEGHSALEGRIKFFMRKNPAKAVLHTRLVELNGFIHGMLSGTPAENRNYTFFGPRVYEGLIAPE